MSDLLARLVTAVLLACAVGCSSLSAGDGAAPIHRLQGRWTLVELDGGVVASTADGRRPTLVISSGGALSGFAGVNRLNARLDVDALEAGGFAVGAIVTTRMAGSPQDMTLEQAFLGALERAEAYELGRDSLGLLSAGVLTARLERAP